MSDKVRYCGKCGYTLVDGVCPVCKTVQNDPVKTGGNQNNNTKKMIAIIVITTIILIGVIVAVFVSLTSSDKDKSEGYSAGSSYSSTESSSAAQASESNKNDEMYRWIKSVMDDGPTGSCWENPDISGYVVLSDPYDSGDAVYVNVEWEGGDSTGRIIERYGEYAIYFEYEKKSMVNKVWITISDKYTDEGSYGEICWKYETLEWEQDSNGYITYDTYHGLYL